MNNRLEQLLAIWQPQKLSLEWVLATVVETQGSSYRKPGAMMLINSVGQYFGLISGGCLEADIMRRARRCWDSEQNQIVCYDMRDEDDLSWQLGIGCGGMVKILLQPITAQNNWLELDNLQSALLNREQVFYVQEISESAPKNRIVPSHNLSSSISARAENCFSHQIAAAPMLAIFGGGIDVVPLVKMAKVLGWQVKVVDPRVSYARKNHFHEADEIIRTPYEQMQNPEWLEQVDAAVVMHHSISLDASALALIANTECQYIGLLGPDHRTEKVFQLMAEQGCKQQIRLSNPVGLDLGGDLPESIALSILSEAHATLEQRSALPLSKLTQERYRNAV